MKQIGSILFDVHKQGWELVRREDVNIEDYRSEKSIIDIPVESLSDE